MVRKTRTDSVSWSKISFVSSNDLGLRGIVVETDRHVTSKARFLGFRMYTFAFCFVEDNKSIEIATREGWNHAFETFQTRSTIVAYRNLMEFSET